MATGEELIRLKYRSAVDTAEENGEELSPDDMKRMMNDVIFRTQDLGRWAGNKLTGTTI